MFTLGGHIGDFVPRGSRHPLRAHFMLKSIKSIAYILNGNCRGGQPQQLCDKIHTHFNWNGVNKAIKQKNMQKSGKYFQ